MLVKTITQKKFKTRPKNEMDEMIKKGRKEDERLVKGKFEFIDAQGGWIDFLYRKWPGESLQQFHFDHGEICEISYGIVKHLNNTYKKIRKMNPEIAEKGPIRGVPHTFEIQSRVRFIPVDYL